jgi:hypothetical protein
MGYAFDPLEARWGTLGAAVLLGVVWALFHLVADLQGAHDLGWIAWHRVGTVATRVLIVWAYNNTGKNILAAVLLHASGNVGWQLTPVNGSHYDPGDYLADHRGRGRRDGVSVEMATPRAVQVYALIMHGVSRERCKCARFA